MSSARAAHLGTHHSKPKELDMSQVRISPRSIVIGLALTAVLVGALTLVVVAQDPEGRHVSVVQEPGVRDASVLPDQVTVVEEVELLPDPSAPSATIYFKFISANTFVPFDDEMTYNYYTSGCMYRTGGSSYTEHSLELPQGAEIDYLRVYFYDNDATHDAAAHLYAYDGLGGSTTIATVSSSGATATYTSEGSGYFSHVVDNAEEALSLSLYYGSATTSALRICGVRIRYQYTLSITDLPVIMNGTSP
jgi:hypothetical protein